MATPEAPKNRKEAAPPKDWGADLRRQVDTLVQLGFPAELGLSDDEYRALFAIPKKIAGPKNLSTQADAKIILVDTSVPLSRQHALIGIRDFINPDEVDFSSNGLQRYAFFTDGTPGPVRGVSENGFRGNLPEATALFIHNRDYYNRNHRTLMIGAKIPGEYDMVPLLNTEIPQNPWLGRVWNRASYDYSVTAQRNAGIEIGPTSLKVLPGIVDLNPAPQAA